MSDHHDELSCRRGQLNVVTIILESGQSELIWMALVCMWHMPYTLGIIRPRREAESDFHPAFLCNRAPDVVV